LDYQEYVKIDDRFLRPAEVDLLIGDASKARQHLNWKPSYSFNDLVSEMVQMDLAEAERLRPERP
jgi:GDPmannose 4,6-dehydratase